MRETRGSGTTGLAVLRSGQRVLWKPRRKIDQLPVAIFDPDYMANHFGTMIEPPLTIRVPLPTPTITVAGIAPAIMITR
jgi:hypothetical protein